MGKFILFYSFVLIALFSTSAEAGCLEGQRPFVFNHDDGFTITTGCLQNHGDQVGWLKEGVVTTTTGAQVIFNTNGEFSAITETIGDMSGSFSSTFDSIGLLIRRSGSSSGSSSGSMYSLSKTQGTIDLTTTQAYTVGAVVESNYSVGKLNGITRTYTINHQKQKGLREERTYRDDHLQGRYVAYNNYQIPIQVGAYLADKRSGFWKFYNNSQNKTWIHIFAFP